MLFSTDQEINQTADFGFLTESHMALNIQKDPRLRPLLEQELSALLQVSQRPEIKYQVCPATDTVAGPVHVSFLENGRESAEQMSRKARRRGKTAAANMPE